MGDWLTNPILGQLGNPAAQQFGAQYYTQYTSNVSLDRDAMGAVVRAWAQSGEKPKAPESRPRNKLLLLCSN